MQAYTLSDSIIREYDLRGPVQEGGITPHQAFCLGLRFGSYLHANHLMNGCAVGYDGRVSSQALFKSLCEGLTKAGIHVVNVGLGPSPHLYYAVQTEGVDAGIMVTGSHNPPQDNGFKISLKSRPFFGADLQALKTIPLHFPRSYGRIKTKSILTNYAQRLLKDYKPTLKPLKIVCDAGSGVTGPVLEVLKSFFEGEMILLYTKVDGTFPYHHPDPSLDQNMQDLKKAVLEHKADVGFAFDGDGDRLGIVDEKGNILSPDHILMILGSGLLQQYPKATMVADVKTSQAFFNEMESQGAIVHMCKTGHSLIKEKMAETGAIFAGEMSGHIFFKDTYFGYDDALYAMVRFLNIIHTKARTVSELVSKLPVVYATPMIKIPCDDKSKFEIIKNLQQSLINQDIRFNDLDGIRFTNEKGWWLIRASNTEPALVARAEAYEEEDLQIIVQSLKNITEQSGLFF